MTEENKKTLYPWKFLRDEEGNVKYCGGFYENCPSITLITLINNDVLMDVKEAAERAMSENVKPAFNMYAVTQVLKRAELNYKLEAITKWQNKISKDRGGHWIHTKAKKVRFGSQITISSTAVAGYL